MRRREKSSTPAAPSLEDRVAQLQATVDRLAGLVEASQSPQAGSELVAGSDFERGYSRALALVEEREASLALERAGHPDGGGVMPWSAGGAPVMEPGTMNWQLQPGQIDAQGRTISGEREQLAARERELEGWQQPEGVLTVSAPMRPQDDWQVRDARTGRVVDEFYGPNAEANARAYVEEHSAPATDALLDFRGGRVDG